LFDIRFDFRAITFFAKLMSPLGKLMTGPLMRKCVEKDLADLKHGAENRTAATE
jgi:hypothetical protein